jgi:hypothetical protein
MMEFDEELDAAGGGVETEEVRAKVQLGEVRRHGGQLIGSVSRAIGSL